MPTRLIRQQCALDATGERTLEMAMKRMSLSAPAHDRILRVARTIADLDSSASIAAKHIAEAIQYRSLDRNYCAKVLPAWRQQKALLSERDGDQLPGKSARTVHTNTSASPSTRREESRYRSDF
jgi:hypothetical protein